MPKFICQIKRNAGQKPTLHFSGNCSNRNLDMPWYKWEFDPNDAAINEKYKVCEECKTKFRNGNWSLTVSNHPSNNKNRSQNMTVKKIMNLISDFHSHWAEEKTINTAWLSPEGRKSEPRFEEMPQRLMVNFCLDLRDLIGESKYRQFVSKELGHDDPLSWPEK